MKAFRRNKYKNSHGDLPNSPTSQWETRYIQITGIVRSCPQCPKSQELIYTYIFIRALSFQVNNR